MLEPVVTAIVDYKCSTRPLARRQISPPIRDKFCLRHGEQINLSRRKSVPVFNTAHIISTPSAIGADLIFHQLIRENRVPISDLLCGLYASDGQFILDLRPSSNTRHLMGKG